MEPVVEPQFAVEVQLGMLYGRLVRIAAQRGGDGERVEQDARGVSAKQEPRARMRFPYPIFTPRGAMSISVRNFIGQKYKFYIFAV